MRSGQKKGKAARWRASDTLMQMIEEELKSNNTAITPSSFSIRVLEAIAEAKRETPREGRDATRPGLEKGRETSDDRRRMRKRRHMTMKKEGAEAALDAGGDPSGDRQGAGGRARGAEQGVLDDRPDGQRRQDEVPHDEVQAESVEDRAGAPVLRGGVRPRAGEQERSEGAGRLAVP